MAVSFQSRKQRRKPAYSLRLPMDLNDAGVTSSSIAARLYCQPCSVTFLWIKTSEALRWMGCVTSENATVRLWPAMPALESCRARTPSYALTGMYCRSVSIPPYFFFQQLWVCSVTPICLIASIRCIPCPIRTSTCRNFTTISSGLGPLIAINGPPISQL